MSDQRAAILVYLAMLFFRSTTLPVSAQDTGNKRGRTITHILDYIALDYRECVQQGRILDTAEYKEQQEFAAEAVRLLQQAGQGGEGLAGQAVKLQTAVQAREPADAVARQATDLRDAVIRSFHLEVLPRSVPDVQAASMLFASRCATCHGSEGRGDGPAGRASTPPASNFHDAGRMEQRSVYSLYNVVTLGVPGTAMLPFQDLPETDRWALAFYVASLRYPEEQAMGGERLFKERNSGAFSTLAELTGVAPKDAIARWGTDAPALYAWLLRHPEALKSGGTSPLEIAKSNLDKAVQAYEAGNKQDAAMLMVAAYLDGFELAEGSLSHADPVLAREIESEMMNLRARVKDEATVEQLRTEVEKVCTLLSRADRRMHGGRLGASTAFWSSFLLLLREGLEAVLILAGIVGVARKAGRRDAMPYIHAGWIAALALGAVTWLAAGRLVNISGATREITEGVTAALAAFMLLYVGLWLHGKAKAGAWQLYVKDSVNAALSSKTRWAMASISFLAVYREVFELVLFYQTLWLQADGGSRLALVAGLASGSLVLALLSWLALRLSVRLPLGMFFTATSGFLAFFAVVFTGAAVSAFQEAGRLDASPLTMLSIPAISFNPTRESLIAQAAMMLVVAIGFKQQRKNS